MHIGNIDGDMEKMLRRLREGNLVRNRSLTWNYKYEAEKDLQNQKSAKVRKTKIGVCHRELASAVAGCGSSNFFRSFSQSPSKLPLDMMSRRSLGLAFAARNSAMASPPETTFASLSRARTLPATVSGSRRFSSPSCGARQTPPRASAPPGAGPPA